jgi:hypothetical protein
MPARTSNVSSLFCCCTANTIISAERPHFPCPFSSRAQSSEQTLPAHRCRCSPALLTCQQTPPTVESHPIHTPLESLHVGHLSPHSTCSPALAGCRGIAFLSFPILRGRRRRRIVIERRTAAFGQLHCCDGALTGHSLSARQQYIQLQYLDGRRWNMGLDQKYLPPPQPYGVEL